MSENQTQKLVMTGAEMVVRSLQLEGVKYVFGYPGGAILHVYDELFKQDAVEHILVRHEQAATHAADGYARATGKPGVALVTSGPGITNAITGIATAYMDSVPMIVISGQVPSQLIGTDAFQEVDAIGITRPCVKHSYLVKDIRELPETMKKAFHIATTGRPGPVHIDLPKDVSGAEGVFDYPDRVEMRSYNPNTQGHRKQIVKAVELLKTAKRPMVYTGGGVVQGNASDLMRQVIKRYQLPITNTLMGLGSEAADSPNFLGMLGMHGTYEANMAMHHCDVLFAVGARFDDRITGKIEKFCPHAKIIHIDVDPSSISKIIKVDVPIVGDVRVVLEKFLEAMNASAETPDYSNWWQQIREWQAVDSLYYDNSDTVIKPQYVMQVLHRLTGGNAIVTSDVGQHQMWAAQYYGFQSPRKWINSGGLGTMGFGYPAAIGAKLACPDEEVFCVTGEGSIQMMLQEMSTALQYHVPTNIICLNNMYLGMVRQWQEFFYDKRYSMSYMDALPDFVKLAESYGHVGMKIERPSDVEGALKEAIALKDRTVFLDFITDQNENVFPMIPSGAGHHEMLLYGRDEMKSTNEDGRKLV
ncbi:biosynthetic-type acetolactate synthase large subunit [Ostreibacterium oceani]|uniref:Acetolactate synthase n=1 Tax=Ostreibacterium oceani TaxID=2654998 RepID=A0A6N7F0V8_9GAMM|nr:biosynthetic-type acetolactate synthase large subunit [Ostreibacterium oceani]MPV85486.1 biosynthetic-type acetolactate synthase large subunit [Ostreibacterium oceani]